MATKADRSQDGAGKRWGRRSGRESHRSTGPGTGPHPEAELTPEKAQAWEEVVRFLPTLEQWAGRRVPRPHAEDIRQSVSEKAWVYLKKEGIEPWRNVRAWMTTVATNEIIDQKRKLKLMTEALVEDHERLPAELDRDVPSSLREQHEKAERMAAELADLLTPREAQIVILHLAYGYKAGEVAEMLGTTSGNVRSTSSFALRKLRAPDKTRAVLYRFGLTD